MECADKLFMGQWEHQGTTYVLGTMGERGLVVYTWEPGTPANPPEIYQLLPMPPNRYVYSPEAIERDGAWSISFTALNQPWAEDRNPAAGGDLYLARVIPYTDTELGPPEPYLAHIGVGMAAIEAEPVTLLHNERQETTFYVRGAMDEFGRCREVTN